MKRIAMGLLVLVFLATVVGCSQPAPKGEQPPAQAGEPRQGGTVTVAMWSEPANFNPHIWPTQYDVYITSLVFDSLVEADTSLKWQPELAEKWDVSPDGRTITFTLREGIKWHDGQPLTAEDVKFTYMSLAHPEYDGGSYYLAEPFVGVKEYHEGKAQDIEGIKVIDERHISFTTPEPMASVWASFEAEIVPKHILKDVSPGQWKQHAFNANPVGTGPFKFVKYVTGQYVELAANPDYFLGRPRLDKIVYRIGDQNTMLAAFLNKEVDIIQVPLGEIESVKLADFAEIHAYDSAGIQYIGFNLLDDRLADLRVRQAIAHAIDRGSIVKSLLRGYGKVINCPMPAPYWAYNDKAPGYAFDRAKAVQLLEEAGWKLNPQTKIREKDGKKLEFELIYPTGNLVRMQAAPVVQQGLAAVGIKVNLQALDFPTLVSRLLPRDKSGKIRPLKPDDFQIYLLGLSFDPDPDGLRTYFHSATRPPKGYNFISYQNERADRLWEESTRAMDFGERQRIYHELMSLLAEEIPWLPLYSEQEIWACNKRVKDFVPAINGFNQNARQWWVEDGK
ncbi:MAG: peptide-binding protein [Bacillota bacterium]|nr:peptide-binding protein [Bacillota bacterium]